MALILGFLLFAAPFLLYALWWRLSGARGAKGPPVIALALGLLGVAAALAGALHYGLSRSFERGEAYVPARISPDGRVIGGEGRPR
ncbi:MAG: hypothetical protein ACK44F_05225 [Roseococcus sp.]|jgi:hypothetical protein